MCKYMFTPTLALSSRPWGTDKEFTRNISSKCNIWTENICHEVCYWQCIQVFVVSKILILWLILNIWYPMEDLNFNLWLSQWQILQAVIIISQDLILVSASLLSMGLLFYAKYSISEYQPKYLAANVVKYLCKCLCNYLAKYPAQIYIVRIGVQGKKKKLV